MRDIKALVTKGHRSNTLQRKIFYVISTNVFCITRERQLVPAELSLAKFSVQAGLQCLRVSQDQLEGLILIRFEIFSCGKSGETLEVCRRECWGPTMSWCSQAPSPWGTGRTVWSTPGPPTTFPWTTATSVGITTQLWRLVNVGIIMPYFLN